MKRYILFYFLLGSFAACKNDDINAELDERLSEVLNQVSNGMGESAFILPDSDDFSKIPQDPQNPLSIEKVELGKLLFHETGIALAPVQEFSKGTFSCASCHFSGAGFQAGRFQGGGCVEFSAHLFPDFLIPIILNSLFIRLFTSST